LHNALRLDALLLIEKRLRYGPAWTGATKHIFLAMPQFFS
jgi:hypothetical protein